MPELVRLACANTLVHWGQWAWVWVWSIRAAFGEEPNPKRRIRPSARLSLPSRQSLPTRPSRSARLPAWYSPSAVIKHRQLIEGLCQKESSPQEKGPGVHPLGPKGFVPDRETIGGRQIECFANRDGKNYSRSKCHGE